MITTLLWIKALYLVKSLCDLQYPIICFIAEKNNNSILKIIYEIGVQFKFVTE